MGTQNGTNGTHRSLLPQLNQRILSSLSKRSVAAHPWHDLEIGPAAPVILNVILILFSILVISVLSIWFRSWKSKLELRNIPGKLGWPLIGETVAFVSDFSSPSGIYSFIKKRQHSYGRVFKTSVLGRFTIFMTGREAGRILLSGKDGVVSLNLSYAGKQVLGPSSLLTTAGEEHRQLRRLIGEPLSIESLKKNVEFINRWAIDALEGWQSRSRVLVLEEASAFTLKVITNMIMSLAPTGEEQEKFRANFKLISATFATLPFKIPGTAFHRGIQARNRMYEMLDRMIAKRRNGEEEVRDDFLQSLLRKHSGDEEDSEKLTDAQLKDNILTLLVAGHDTTTAALTWFVKFLGDNPDVLQNLREEHLQIQSARSDSSSDHVTWSEVNSMMPYTNKVISETLRKATILPWFSRKAAQNFTIDGYEIKKNWAVNLDVVSMHHDPSVFPDPEKFDPSRFDMPLKAYSFLGFGHGPRMCPGMHLAKLEICIFIHHFLCRYKWKSLDEDESLNPTLVRMPKNKYPIAVEQL